MPSEGIDVSHHNGAINWPQVAAAGIRFTMIKATDGPAGHDPTFPANWAGAANAGIVRGAYHFLRPATSAGAQVNNFTATVGALGAHDLAPALDMEDENLWNNVPGAVDLAVEWLQTVEAYYHRTPYFYSSPNFINTVIKGDARLSAYPLWLARWGNAPGPIPAPWTAWSLWQYSAQGTVAGVNGAVDRDQSYGVL